MTDADLQLIGRLRHTTTLALNDTSISDDGISSLSGLSNLRELMLRNTAVDDAAISLLVKFGKLQQLHLDGTRLSGEGLSDLVHTLKATAPSLIVTCDSFDLNGAGEIEFDSPRWDWLAKRTQDLDTENRIKLLDFSHSAASDAHLPPLMGLKNVQMIDFRGS